MDSKRKVIGFLPFVSLYLVVIPVIAVSSSCANAKKLALEAKLSELTTKSDRLRQSIAEQESVLQALNQRLNVQRAALGEYSARVQGYMLEHKMAVAAIAAGVGGIETWDPKNKYSEDVKSIGAAAAFVAAIWAVENMDEIGEVVKTLNQADAHVRSLEAEISQTSSATQQQQTSIQQGEERLRSLAQEEAALGGDLKDI